MGVAGLDCYTAAKGGIAAITRSMAVEFAPQKVRVNAIAPAATMTDRVRSRLEAGNPRVTKIAEAHLFGQIEPEDIANMAVSLVSDEARMITGHVYPVDSRDHHFVTDRHEFDGSADRAIVRPATPSASPDTQPQTPTGSKENL